MKTWYEDIWRNMKTYEDIWRNMKTYEDIWRNMKKAKLLSFYHTHCRPSQGPASGYRCPRRYSHPWCTIVLTMQPWPKFQVQCGGWPFRKTGSLVAEQERTQTCGGLCTLGSLLLPLLGTVQGWASSWNRLTWPGQPPKHSWCQGKDRKLIACLLASAIFPSEQG